MTYGSSQIGFTTALLTSNRAPSQIGFAAGSLSNPGTSGASPIGFAAGSVLSSQRPIAVLDGTQLVYVPIRTWTGTKLL